MLYQGIETVSDDKLDTTRQVSIDNNATYEVVASSSMATDGVLTENRTNRGTTGTLLRTEQRVTSADQRNVSVLMDRDGDGDIDWAEVQVKNADGSTTDRVKGNATFNAPSFARVATVATNLSGGTTTTIVDSDANDVKDSITTIVESANGFSTTTTFDTDANGTADLTKTREHQNSR